MKAHESLWAARFYGMVISRSQTNQCVVIRTLGFIESNRFKSDKFKLWTSKIKFPDAK